MTTSSYCSHCGKPLEPNFISCPFCGVKIESTDNASGVSIQESIKSPKITWLLCLFFGMLGLHRLYVKKIGTGLVMLITLGGFGLWTLFDLLSIVNNKFEDREGHCILFYKNPSALTKSLFVIGSILAWLVIFVVIVFSLAFYFTSGITKAVHNELDALRNGDINKAYSYTSKDFQHSVSIDQFRLFIKHYPSLSNNKSSTFNEREVRNNSGFIKGVLTAEDGAKTPIEVNLIKEDGIWKILSIKLQPTGVQIERQDSASTQDTSLKIYRTKFYSIKYPADWNYEKPKQGVVLFNGKKGSPAYFATVNIQTILSKKAGGQYSSLAEIKSDLTKQIMTHDPNAKIIAQGKAELPTNPKAYQGEYLVFTHTINNHMFKQMQLLLNKENGLAFYSWTYTSPEEIYDQYLPIAQKMYESWVLNGC